MAFINRKQLDFEVSSQVKTLRDLAKKEVRDKIFLPAVMEMQTDFEFDDVTQEIQGGAGAPNITKSLAGTENLYSFIGFDANGPDPLEPIRQSLIEGGPSGPRLKYIRATQRQFRYEFRVYAPDLENIYRDTPIPWLDGASWADRVEKGIPGLSKYLRRMNTKNSRSGGGIQVKKNIRSAKYRPQPYLRAIFNRFLSRFGNRNI